MVVISALQRQLVARKKLFHFFTTDVHLSQGGAGELKLPFDSESKTTSGCSDSLFSKKTPLTVCFHSLTNGCHNFFV